MKLPGFGSLKRPAAPDAAKRPAAPRGGLFTKGRPRQGLVIHLNEIEAVVYHGPGGGRRVVVPLAGQDKQSLTQAVQKALESAQIVSQKLPVSIPTREVLFRFFAIPSIPRAEQEGAVRFEVRKYIPFKTEALVWDFQTAPGTVPAKLDVLFAAIPRDALQTIQGALAAANVQPTLLEPRTLSLCRLVGNLFTVPVNEFLCIVDVQGDTAHIVISRDRRPYLARDVSLQARMSDQAEPGSIAPQPGGDPQRLLSELSVSVDYFAREYPSASISRILLFGPQALLGPWSAKLAEQFHCPVETGEHLLQPALEGSLAQSSAAMIGLLKSIDEPRKVLIDFQRRSAPQRQSAEPAKRGAGGMAADLDRLLTIVRSPQIVVTGGAVLAACLAVLVLSHQWVSQEQGRLDRMVRERQDVGWGLTGMPQDQLQPIQDKTMSQLTFVRKIMQDERSLAQKFDALARALPDGVWLMKILYDHPLDANSMVGFRFEISGGCYRGAAQAEIQAIQELEHKIKGDARFLEGFTTARVEQINIERDLRRGKAFRTFELRCRSEKL